MPPSAQGRGAYVAGPGRTEIRSVILEMVRARGPERPVCPSEVARSLTADWRAQMPVLRAEAAALAAAGAIEITQRGRVIDAASARGPVRLREPRSA